MIVLWPAVEEMHRPGQSEYQICLPEQFQEKCVAVFRPELRKNKGIEQFQENAVRFSVRNCVKNKETRQLFAAARGFG
ncbi:MULTISPECIES: hypothetical protein [unclassified Mesorhizobium]|uniref:hypothetical protein n=1 Tax=unclassified Mesorhizobium TaxID=325217 RepID=UPI00167769CA|nr:MULTISPECIES: hypothetical protein [unclassified Mesorhizobium]